MTKADPAAGLSHEERTRVFAEALRRLEHEPGKGFDCPYLEGREARHLNLLFNQLQPGFYHALMDLNFRRMGPLVYRPQCPDCQACQNLRIPVASFRPSRSQQRALAKNLDLTIEVGPSAPTAEKHALYRRYLAARHDGAMDGSQLEFELLYSTTIETLELRYRSLGQLLAVGLADLEPQAMSAVYCYFDPSQPRRSLGVLNVLRMIEECRLRAIPHLYLGYWIRASGTMGYKADFRPAEVLSVDGCWSPLSPKGPGIRPIRIPYLRQRNDGDGVTPQTGLVEDLMNIRPETQIAEVASAHPATIRVFQRHGVDFCCGGKRPLSEVCDEKGLAFDDLRQELATAVAGTPASQRSWQDAPLGELVSFIVDRYHQWLKDELPRLTQMMNKVLAVHGQRHPDLQAVGSTFEAILGEIGPHMMKEEHVLFPCIVQMGTLAESGEGLTGSPFGSVRNPIGSMEFDHQALGDLLVDLRKQTGDFTPPDDACNTYRGLFHGLTEMERELQEHIHLENNVLHPRSIALEEKLQAVVAV